MTVVASPPLFEPLYLDIDKLYHALEGVYRYIYEKNDETDMYNLQLRGSELNTAVKVLEDMNKRYKFDPAGA